MQTLNRKTSALAFLHDTCFRKNHQPHESGADPTFSDVQKMIDKEVV